jgi:transposase
MQKFLECCAGIDIGKRELTATILMGPPDQEPQQETRTFGTVVAALEECLAWLLAHGCRSVIMESTGTYWVPVWNVLHEKVAVVIANPEHVKARRGEKTDPEDSRRLAERLRVGTVRGSFIPSEHIQQLRDLTRRRKRLLGAANSERNRIQKMLERGNVKIGNIVSDVCGISGQRILQALLRNADMTPRAIAELAKGRLRSKLDELTATLEGHRLDAHLRWMIQHSLDHLVFLEQQLAELRVQIEQQLQPLEREYELLQTIPGVGAEIAAVILAETGGNMHQFPSGRHLTSWAGVCPGNNRSAGKQKSSHIKRANCWLLPALVQAGWAAVRQRGSIFKKRFYRQMQHRGRKRAVIATARALLNVVWQVLQHMSPYVEPENELMRQREHSKKVQHHLRRLRQLGVDVSALAATVPPDAEAPAKPRFRPVCQGALGLHAR